MAAEAAESRKHQNNDTKCSELGWQCIPLAVETYGKEARNTFSYIAMQKAVLKNSSKSQVLGDHHTGASRAMRARSFVIYLVQCGVSLTESR